MNLCENTLEFNCTKPFSLHLFYYPTIMPNFKASDIAQFDLTVSFFFFLQHSLAVHFLRPWPTSWEPLPEEEPLNLRLVDSVRNFEWKEGFWDFWDRLAGEFKDYLKTLQTNFHFKLNLMCPHPPPFIPPSLSAPPTLLIFTRLMTCNRDLFQAFTLHSQKLKSSGFKALWQPMRRNFPPCHY